jgi:NDP-sugar pyrophosphorylase family protein
MKAMVFAAGEGTRLRPLTLSRPKPMLDIGGKPLLEHTFLWLKRYGITQIAVNLHYKGDFVQNYFSDGKRWGLDITYSRENEILGTAGGLKKMEPYFDGTLVVAYGDVLTDVDLARLVSFHTTNVRKLRTPCVTALLYEVANPTECGIVELGPDGRILRIVEKPKANEVFSNLANAGILVFEPEILGGIPVGIFSDLAADVIPGLIAKGIPVFGVPLAPGEYLVDIGSPERYQSACREWRRRHPDEGPSVRRHEADAHAI